MTITFTKANIFIHYTKGLEFFIYFPPKSNVIIFLLQNRLDQMLYVGLTEDHEESARFFAYMVGAQVLSQSGTLNLDLKEDVPSETGNTHCNLVVLTYYCVFSSCIYVILDQWPTAQLYLLLIIETE